MWVWSSSLGTLTWNSFSFFTTSQMEGSFSPLVLVTSAYHFSSFLIYSEFSLVHFEEMPYGFSLAHRNHKHHCFCVSEPLLRKIRVIWTQTLWHHSSQSDDWDGDWVANGRVGYTWHVDKKAGSHPGWDRAGQWEISSRYSEWHTM